MRPSFPRHAQAGKPVRIPSDPMGCIADGLLAVEVGANHPSPIIEAYVDEVVQVEDDALCNAMRVLLDRMKLVAEPSGAGSRSRR